MNKKHVHSVFASSHVRKIFIIWGVLIVFSAGLIPILNLIK